MEMWRLVILYEILIKMELRWRVLISIVLLNGLGYSIRAW